MNAPSTPKMQTPDSGSAPECGAQEAFALPASILARLASVRAAASRPAIHIATYIGAVLLLLAGLAIALNALPEGVRFENPVYGWLVFFIVAPAIVAMNALETEFAARILGVSFGARKALRIAVLSSAANMLPLPGGPIVRATALKERGVKLIRSGALISAITVLWLGLVFIYTGACLAAYGQSLSIGGLFAAAGAGALALSIAWLRRLSCSFKQIFLMGALKLATSIIGVVGLWWTFALVGAFPEFVETSVFSASAISSLVVTFAPAGLGVTETATAAMAMLVSISPALAFIVSAIFRAIWLAFLLPLAALFAFTHMTDETKTS